MPYMSEARKVRVSREFFALFLDKGSFTFEELKKHGLFFEDVEQGSAVLVHQGFFVTIWVGVNNVSLMIGKEEIKSFKFLLQETSINALGTTNSSGD
jgi:hypothetical protein